jgi:hypothetical protein
MPRLRALLCDLSGTLHVGDVPTPGASAAIQKLRDRGIPIRWLSNTSKESREWTYFSTPDSIWTLKDTCCLLSGVSLLGRMKRMGLDVRQDEVRSPLSCGFSIFCSDKCLFHSSAAIHFPVCRLATRRGPQAQVTRSLLFQFCLTKASDTVHCTSSHPPRLKISRLLPPRVPSTPSS